MKFSEKIRKDNDDVFQAIFHHPFVQGIGKGNLPRESIIHYLKADYGYLNAFLELYGVAISKARSRQDVAFFAEKLDFVLYSEEEAHLNLCKVAKVNYEDLQGYPLPPTADHFVKHMMYHAYTGGLGELIAALLPCPWTYYEIGVYLKETFQPTREHPFYDWIHFYADPNIVELKMIELLDEIAKDASTHDKMRMEDAFRKSSQLELGFWEMAYTCEEWEPKN